MGFHNIPPEVVDAREIATGSYTGDGTDNRQITTGFKCSFVITWGASNREGIMIPSKAFRNRDASELTGGTALHGTDGFIVYETTDFINSSGYTYYYWAISE